MPEKYTCSLNLSEYELDIKFEIKGDPEYIEEFLTDRALNQIADRLGQPTWESLKKKMNDEVKNNICKHCWHDTGIMLTAHPPLIEQYCCHCNEKRTIRTHELVDKNEHGKYLKLIYPCFNV